MAWFERKPAAPGPERHLTRDGTSAERQAGVPSPATSPLMLSSFVELSAQLGEWQRVLTTGDDAVYPITPALADQVMALDLGARQAVIVCVASDDPALALQVRQLAARLRAGGYTVTGPRLATRQTIVDVLRHPGQLAVNASTGPIALFLSWIDRAEACDATDVHVEIRGNTAQVRVRVDGLLEPLADGVSGRYSAKDALDAIAAGYNSTRKGSTAPVYEPEKFLDCMIAFNTARASGQLRFQNVRGRLGPKAVIRLLRQDRVADRLPVGAAVVPGVSPAMSGTRR